MGGRGRRNESNVKMAQDPAEWEMESRTHEERAASVTPGGPVTPRADIPQGSPPPPSSLQDLKAGGSLGGAWRVGQPALCPCSDGLPHRSCFHPLQKPEDWPCSAGLSSCLRWAGRGPLKG